MHYICRLNTQNDCFNIFKNNIAIGQRGDHINEMGWMIGEIVDDIRRSDIEQKTLVVFMSNHFQSLCNNDESNELKGLF